METSKVLKAAEVEVQQFDWGSLQWFASAELGNSEALTTGICTLKPGRGNPRHHHPNCEEVLHVLEGSIAHVIEDGSEVELAAGDTITLPVGAAHSARNVGEKDAVLFICFSSAEREVVGEASLPA
jgi:quercetin dioxygenase-like cupin family protein